MKNVTDFRKAVETGVDPRPKLLLNDEFTASCPTNILPKHYIKCYKEQK